ncbi:MAG: hypothetical protein BWY42_00847 [Candidatus Omnitrophica bacterium ADurb.Bin277]|nr:MAG: hypothetical protein BWY42_00847 [Candidatus Omnitrophica bacterium ADurb.Bin277]
MFAISGIHAHIAARDFPFHRRPVRLGSVPGLIPIEKDRAVAFRNGSVFSFHDRPEDSHAERVDLRVMGRQLFRITCQSSPLVEQIPETADHFGELSIKSRLRRILIRRGPQRLLLEESPDFADPTLEIIP